MNSVSKTLLLINMTLSQLSRVPTADQINSIKPDQAIGYWSGTVGMIDRAWSGRSTLVGVARASYTIFFDMSKKLV